MIVILTCFSRAFVTIGHTSLKYFSRYLGNSVAKDDSSANGPVMSSGLNSSIFQWSISSVSQAIGVHESLGSVNVEIYCMLTFIFTESFVGGLGFSCFGHVGGLGEWKELSRKFGLVLCDLQPLRCHWIGVDYCFWIRNDTFAYPHDDLKWPAQQWQSCFYHKLSIHFYQ